MIYRKHFMVSINHVNPIYIKGVEQIHMVTGLAFGDPATMICSKAELD